MLDAIRALSQTPLPGILAVAGAFFIFLSLGGKLGAQIITDNIPKLYAAIVGVLLLFCALAMFLVSATMQSREVRAAQRETPLVNVVEAYKLRPTLPTNQPISQVVEVEANLSSADKSITLSLVAHKEYVITILGRDVDGEPSVATRKHVSDVSTTTVYIRGRSDPQVTTVHGELEGKEVIAHRTAEGLWHLKDLPGATEKQKKAMMMEGFMDPFAGFPYEKVPVGKVITSKDEETSLILGTALPGKKEGSVAVKFERVIKEREPVAQLSCSMNVSVTTLDENKNEVFFKMSLNGGGRLSLGENAKINATWTLTGILTITTPTSPNVVMTGPCTIRALVKEL